MSYVADARTVFHHLLTTLDHLASKAGGAGLGDAVLGARIADDMFPLELQFRVAVNQSILALIRNAGQDTALEEVTYTSLAEVGERVRAIRALVEGVPETAWAAADSEIDFALPNGQRFVMSAAEHVRDWILPNLYFHVTMAYAILRHNGLELGKFEFVPQMARYARDAN